MKYNNSNKSLFANKVLLMRAYNLYKFGEFDENTQISQLNILQKIVILKYIKAINEIDKFASSIKNAKCYYSFALDTWLVTDIGMFLTNKLRDALRKRNKEEIKESIALIKAETSRIYEEIKLQGIYKESLSREYVEEIIKFYKQDQSQSYDFLDYFSDENKVVYDKKQMQKEDDAISLK